MKYEYIDTDEALGDFCSRISGASSIAFDTEFVSEDRYFPDLCLVQVAAGGEAAIIDPLMVSDLQPFWQTLVEPGHVTIVHAGREEFRFCRRAVGCRPANWFDTQIASGLVGIEYPAAYGTLIRKLLGTSLGKGETRTDWRRRPLSKQQLSYAVQDVNYLAPLHEELTHRLDAMQRHGWLVEELNAWQDRLELDESTARWRRVSGISGLSARQLGSLREIWKWREENARARNVPPRRVLRDDLLVELARRGSSNPHHIRTLRGMDWKKHRNAIPEIAQCIARALEMPDDQCPKTGGTSAGPQFQLLGQFLATAVKSMARSAHVAPGLIGSLQDVRDLIAHHLGYKSHEPPVLATGWRAKVVGQAINQLLDGELAIRITDPTSDQPLRFESVEDQTS
ncbi:MAG: ribonuclease D [Planctomycetota bacterium]